MLRELLNNELVNVSGGLPTQVIAPVLPGYVLVGWTQEVTGYDTFEWTENQGLFNKIVHTETVPIYNIQPLYEEVFFTTTYIF